MPRRILKALASGLCGLAWRSGGDESTQIESASEEGSDTFVYDLRAELEHGRD